MHWHTTCYQWYLKHKKVFKYNRKQRKDAKVACFWFLLCCLGSLPQDRRLPERKAEQIRRPLSSLIKFKPQPKKLKLGSENDNKQFESSTKLHEVKTKAADDESGKQETGTSSAATGLMGLVSYSDESEEDT